MPPEPRQDRTDAVREESRRGDPVAEELRQSGYRDGCRPCLEAVARGLPACPAHYKTIRDRPETTRRRA